MKWLEWTPVDVENAIGGVEIHIRCLIRELRALGIDAVFSSDRQAIRQKTWDVIHTHGCWPLPTSDVGSAVRLHTLHGTTLGRMAACKEWFWPGGYRAYFNECKAVWQSHGVLSVHPGLHLLDVAKHTGRLTDVCWNGWDSGVEVAELPSELKQNLAALGPFLCYVGRSHDPVKNSGPLTQALLEQPWPVVVVPGDGFPDQPSKRWIHTGPLNPSQVKSVMQMSRGLLLSSLYEGLPLVVLEALAQGVPVLTTRVGGLSFLDAQLKNLCYFTESSEDWAFEIQEFCHRPWDALGIPALARWNQGRLPTWKLVAERTRDLAFQIQALQRKEN